ncbi:MAG: MucB/RseB C-terminal domain-containing protein [Burkholderiales bacterium]|nr:MucB/RseB C-terminal domain-containing protein [Burkholderiales bacterium]
MSSKKMLRLGLCGLLLIALGAQASDLLTTSESSDILHKMISGARNLNYSGIYVYQHGDVMEMFRVAHVFDAGGEQERRESLDGIPREFVRVGNQIVCLLPSQRPFVVDTKVANKFFPGIIPEQATDVLANYNFRRYGTERVAGHECQTIMLEPRDKLRLPHKLCIEPNSGLMLKSTTFSTSDQTPIERFTFSQLDIGGEVDPHLLKPSFAVRLTPQEVNPQQPALAELPVSASAGLPNGFKLVKDMQSQMPGKPKPVRHYVYSDGLASVSVFIEPADNGPVSLPLKQGRVSFFSRETQGWRITAIGEVPPQTVQLFAMAFEPHG